MDDAPPPSAIPAVAGHLISEDLSHLSGLAARADAYLAAAQAPATLAAYNDDWLAWLDFCRRRGCPVDHLTPEAVALYLTDLTDTPSPKTGRRRAVTTVRRRLYGLVAQAQQRGYALDSRHTLITQILDGIEAVHYAPPRRKDALSPDDIRAMVGHLPLDRRGLRNRAILLLGYVSALRRAELVGLEAERPDDRSVTDCTGWIEWHGQQLLVVTRGKRGRWREVPVGPGASDWTCPVTALRRWLDEARIVSGAVFRPIAPNGAIGGGPLAAKQILYLVQRTALAAGVRADLPEEERMRLFGAHSLRAGVPTYADIDERRVQRHLGHSSVTTTRLYQRDRDRFHVNVTASVGL